MGAALSGARRYALFTLVGIAGEDDLDAPDLPVQSGPPAQKPSPRLSPSSTGRNGKSRPPMPIVTLNLEASCRQGDELLAEVASISTFDSAAEWAKRIIPIKNTLISDHARDVEAALEGKLAQFGDAFEEGAPATSEARCGGPVQQSDDAGSLATQDRSTLTFGHTPRRHDKAHLKFVAAQPCLLCNR